MGSEENSERLRLLVSSLGVLWLLLSAPAQPFIPEALLFPGFHCPFSSATVTASKAEGLKEFPACGGDPAAGECWQPPIHPWSLPRPVNGEQVGLAAGRPPPEPILLQMPCDYPKWQSPAQAQLGTMMTHQPESDSGFSPYHP